MVDRAALPISRQRAQNPMGNRTRVIRSVAVDSIVAGQRSFRCWSNPRAIPPRKAAPIPCQKVGSLTQSVKPSIQSWAVALAIASRSTGVRSSRNCCRSSVALRVIRSVAVDSIVAGRGSDPSDSVEEVCQCLIVFCFGLEGPPVDGPGVRGIQTSGSDVPAVLLIVSHFNQGCDVGVEGSHRVGSFGML